MAVRVDHRWRIGFPRQSTAHERRLRCE
jgi:hypothetical protein